MTFWTLLGGFIAAGIGGMIGGAFTRAEATEPPVVVRNTPARSATPARSDERVFVDDDATTRM